MARIAGVLVSLLLLAAAAALPAGAQTTYAAATVSVSDTTVVYGQTITISGTNFGPGAAITITINPTLTTTANASGAWSTPFTVTNDLAAGTHTVTATDGTVTASTTFEVATSASAAATTTGGSLPFTGSDNSPDYVRWALGAIGVGGVLLAFGRHQRARRRSSLAA